MRGRRTAAILAGAVAGSAASVAQSSKDLKLVIAAVAQLTAGQATLSGLYAASNAAKL